MTTEQHQYFFYKVRTNCLPLQDGKCHTNEDVKCKICSIEDEDLAHFLSDYPEYAEGRNMTRTLQRHYKENR